VEVEIKQAASSRLSRARVAVIHSAAEVRSARTEPWWHYASPLGLLAGLWRSRHLIRQFAWREVRGRYQGSHLGLVWSLATPILMLLVYTFVFNFVFRARWGVTPGETSFEFALTLFAGLAVFNVFSETLVRAPGLVLGQPNLVKKVVFPLEVLPAAALTSATIHAAFGLVLVLCLAVVSGHGLSWSALFLPVILVPRVFLALGLGWFLASLGTFVRDTGPAVIITVQLLMFLTPVFYPLHAVPEGWQGLLSWNPLAVIIENTRRVLLWQQWPQLKPLAATGLAALVVLQAGYIWFMKSKRAFADVV
jgi:lipopolysaccharide transport system permease protein